MVKRIWDQKIGIHMTKIVMLDMSYDVFTIFGGRSLGTRTFRGPGNHMSKPWGPKGWSDGLGTQKFGIPIPKIVMLDMSYDFFTIFSGRSLRPRTFRGPWEPYVQTLGT
jgi:hypothetical protein